MFTFTIAPVIRAGRRRREERLFGCSSLIRVTRECSRSWCDNGETLLVTFSCELSETSPECQWDMM